jgi:hypothetical protein
MQPQFDHEKLRAYQAEQAYYGAPLQVGLGENEKENEKENEP